MKNNYSLGPKQLNSSVFLKFKKKKKGFGMGCRLRYSNTPNSQFLSEVCQS